MGRIVGDKALFLHVVDIAVDPEHQGTGSGRWLWQHSWRISRRTLRRRSTSVSWQTGRLTASMHSSDLNPSRPVPLAWQYGSTSNDDGPPHHRHATGDPRRVGRSGSTARY
ncbi:hypothetical protein [Sphingomonas nostoxanthinifaciens]|uniref:hypothetical protein n=1 Tax=Sphingomonas nostoxanthinifaciens TaxID=2872652 RepID=UPI0037DA0DD2